MGPTRTLPDPRAWPSLDAAVRALGVTRVVRAVLAADPGTPDRRASAEHGIADPVIAAGTDPETDPDRCPCRPFAGAA